MTVGVWNFKPVCIMKAIFLAATLFSNMRFATCYHYSPKLILKIGLTARTIASSIMKDKIELVYVK